MSRVKWVLLFAGLVAIVLAAAVGGADASAGAGPAESQAFKILGVAAVLLLLATVAAKLEELMGR